MRFSFKQRRWGLDQALPLPIASFLDGNFCGRQVTWAALLAPLSFRFNPRHYPFNSFRSLLGTEGRDEAPAYASPYLGEWRHPTSGGHVRTG